MTNCKITIDNGIISKIEPAKGVIIAIDGKESHYGNAEIKPAFTDSHGHIWGLGMMNLGMNISGGKDAEETIEFVKRNNFYRGDFIVGRGWNNENWQGKKFPTKELLDKDFLYTPVALIRIDGHAVWCNSFALQIAGIDENTPDPVGGQISKDDKGKPNGILIDNAMDLVNAYIPDYSREQLGSFILKGLEICKNNGITAVHDMDVAPHHIDIYRELVDENLVPIRIYAYAGSQNDESFEHNIVPYEKNNFKIQGIKLFADGALGSYGAALLEDYSDKKGERGLLMLNEEQVLEKSLRADDLGFDIAIHAIGDRAVREVLNAFEKFRKMRPKSKAKLRIEHSQIVNPQDIIRYKELNVIASVQPIHFTADAEMALQRLGKERLLSSAYPWKSFLNSDVLMVAGSDFPIESYSTKLGLDAFISRESNLKNIPEIYEQKISEEDALNCYIEKPYLALGINNIGKIAVGYRANFNIYDSGELASSVVL